MNNSKSRTRLTTAEIACLGWTHVNYLDVNRAAHDGEVASRVARPPPLLFGNQAQNPGSIPLYTLDSLSR